MTKDIENELLDIIKECNRQIKILEDMKEEAYIRLDRERGVE